MYNLKMSEYSIYVIRSAVDGRLYVGMSAHVSKRVHEHNSGEVFSTKGYRPWRLVYQEYIGSRAEARKREKYLKSGTGKEQLKNFIPG